MTFAEIGKIENPESQYETWLKKLLIKLQDYFGHGVKVEYNTEKSELRVGPTTIEGLFNILSLNFSEEEMVRLVDGFFILFKDEGYELFDRRKKSDKDEYEERVIRIFISNETPVEWYEEYKKELHLTGKLNGASYNFDPEDPDLEEWIERWRGSITIYPKNLSDKGDCIKTLFHELDHVLWLWEKGSFLDCFHDAYRNRPHEKRAEKRGARWEKHLKM